MKFLNFSLPYRIKILGLFLLMAVYISCSEENGVDILEADDTEQIKNDNLIVSGKPENNDFIVTASYESLFTVDAKTGKETLVYTFSDQTDVEKLADYDEGNLFVTTDDNSVNAINLANKNLLWSTPMLNYDTSSYGITPPACVDGICYASGTYGVVVALDQNTGELLWYYSTDPNGDLDDGLNENRTPVVHDDRVFVMSEESFYGYFPTYLHILDKETGQLLQKIEFPEDIEVINEPLIVNNILYISVKNLYAIDLQSLEVIWIFEAEKLGDIHILNNKLVVQGEPMRDTVYSSLFCLDSQTGELQWEIETGFKAIWSPIIVENVVYGLYDQGSSLSFYDLRPYAVSLSNGEQLWFRDDISVDNSPVYANGQLFYHGHAINYTDETKDNSGIMALNANNGNIDWLNPAFRFGTSMAPLVVGQNGVFGPSYYRGRN